MELTLEQLKQQNAKAEAEAQAESQEVIKDVIQDEYAEVDDNGAAVEEEVIVDESNDGDLEEEAKTETETELWMQDEEQNSSTSEETFDSSHMAKLRRKMKAKLEEEKSQHEIELAQLKAEIEAMKSGVAPAPTAQVSAKPNRDDFWDKDDPEEAYMDALTDWKLDQREQKTQTVQQQSAQQAQIEQAKQEHEKKLASHYEQAQELIASKVITPEAYQNSEVILRKALDNLQPGTGDLVTDNIIAHLSSLGEGSAKVIYHLGRNSANRERLTNALVSDPSGLQAMGVLGEIKAKLTSAPAKKISTAPAPSATLSGGENVGSSEAKLLRKYKDAHKRGDAQAAFDAKAEAKANKINTRNWS